MNSISIQCNHNRSRTDRTNETRRNRHRRARRSMATTTMRYAAVRATTISSSIVSRVPTRVPTRVPARVPTRASSSTSASTSAPSSTSASGFTVASWNVNGLRALLKKNPRALDDVANRANADVLVLQETKLGVDGEDALGDATFLTGYAQRAYATSAARKGYSGVAVFVRDGAAATIEATSIGAGAFDAEGRVLTTELDACVVVNAYVPNSGADLKRLDDRVDVWERAMRAHLLSLRSRGKPVIYCGDLNVAHEDVDLWGRHKENAKSAGFTPRERACMTALLSECDLVDTFREFKGPDARAFTYWSYRGGAREKNRGWRLDYVLASASTRDRILDAWTLPDVLGSDHCPIAVRLDL